MDRRLAPYWDTPAGFAARAQSDARRLDAAEAPASRLFFGSCAIDTAAHALYISGTERHLQPRGFQVLLYLIRNRHRVVSKDELLDAIWPTCHVTENVVARCVMKLRRAIGDDERCGRIIRTIHRVGYRFDATVEQGWAGDRPVLAPGAALDAAGATARQQARLSARPQDSVRMALYAPVAKSVDAQDLKKI
jgi:DNA-binding winged helix-turn-helix (wHTH) protein